MNKVSQRGKKLTQLAKVSAAGFSAALAANFDASDLSAAIVSIDFSPNSVAWDTSANVNMGTAGGVIAKFVQYNDSTDKNLLGIFATGTDIGMVGWKPVGTGDVLTGNSFGGNEDARQFSSNATGTQYQGFIDNSGNVGWFAFDLGGSGGKVEYITGQFGNAGESLTVGGGGGGTVPEPGHVGLSLLALGAVGLRRRRALKKQTAGE